MTAVCGSLKNRRNSITNRRCNVEKEPGSSNSDDELSIDSSSTDGERREEGKEEEPISGYVVIPFGI